MFVFLVCLSLWAFSVDGSGYIIGTGDLYAGYNREYAGAYHNYQKSYAYEYGVSDPHTGDHKSQWETKDNEGTVRGSYSLLEPDGTTRIVDYIADDNGFRAVVKKVGIHGTSVESHGGEAVQESHAVAPIIAAEQNYVHLPEPVVPQQQYVEQGPVYHSYDGGLDNYQNQAYQVSKYPVAEGYVAASTPLAYQQQQYLSAPENIATYQQPQQYVAAPEKVALAYQQPQQYLASNEKVALAYQQPQQYLASPEKVAVAYQQPQQYLASPEKVAVSYSEAQQYLAAPQKVAVAYEQPQQYVAPQKVAVAYEQPQQYVAAPQKVPLEYGQPQQYEAQQYLAAPQRVAVAYEQEQPQQYVSAPREISYEQPQQYLGGQEKVAYSLPEQRYEVPQEKVLVQNQPASYQLELAYPTENHGFSLNHGEYVSEPLAYKSLAHK